MNKVKVALTQYGPSPKIGGWDKYGDSDTDAGVGIQNRKLTRQSCALTDTVRDALGALPGDNIEIDLGGGQIIYRVYDDRAPEANARVDLYQPIGFDSTIPDGLSSPVYVSLPVRKAGLA